MDTAMYWQDPQHHTGDRVPFLIHSLTNHFELIADITRITKPKHMLEIGSESGGSTLQLLELAKDHDATLTTIEPIPDATLQEARQKAPHYDLIAGKSLEVLDELPFFPELTVVDGDHNYYTVYHELTKLIAHRKSGNFAIILHDVGFPCARRDFYYNPDDIPADYLHPHSFHDGALPGVKRLVKNAGFSGAGNMAAALEEGGPKNGVLTAIEDFLGEHRTTSYLQTDAVFGVGVLFGGSKDYKAKIEDAVAPFTKAIIGKMERNRMAVYLRLVEAERQNGILQENVANLQRRVTEKENELTVLQDTLAVTQQELNITQSGRAYRLQRFTKKTLDKLIR